MIKVVAKHVVDVAKIDEFVEMGRKVVAASQQDAGNVYYTLNRDVKNPSVYTILEAWESMEVLEAHMQTEHFKTYVPLMSALLAEEPVLDIYEEV